MNTEQKPIGKFLLMYDWPAEVLASVIELATEFQWLLPAWCHVVPIVWDSSCEHPMSCSIETDYRRIRLRVGPSFLDDQPKHRRECFVHELIHGFLQLHDDYARDAINRILPDGENDKLKSVVLEELRERNEQVTQDLAFVLAQKI